MTALVKRIEDAAVEAAQSLGYDSLKKDCAKRVGDTVLMMLWLHAAHSSRTILV